MSTPVKIATSLVLNTRRLSPRSPIFLSPIPNENKHHHSTKLTVEGTPLHFKKIKQEKSRNSDIKITINEDFNNEDCLLIDSPNKTNLLNYGLNKYDLLYLIGKGSFGTVIKGKYRGEIVAVKLINLYLNQNNESNALHLVHENIIRILDVIVGKKFGLVIMEYYEHSRNLQSVLDDNKFDLNRKNILLYSQDIANGLRYCHQNQVLHLDIKPTNILLCNNSFCKICDFGNSMKEFKCSEYKFHGTVAYTAPEILKGKKPSAKSDVYSLGILIWQLMTRKCPYEFLDNEVVIYKVVKFDFRPSLDHIDERLSKLCRLCWSGNPEERPRSLEVCEILKNIE